MSYAAGMQIGNRYYVIVDLEATCSRDATVPREEMEIIEIGAVMVDARTFETSPVSCATSASAHDAFPPLLYGLSNPQ